MIRHRCQSGVSSAAKQVDFALLAAELRLYGFGCMVSSGLDDILVA